MWTQLEREFQRQLNESAEPPMITLPSGRRLIYHKGRCRDGLLEYFGKDPASQRHRFTMLQTYGGKLFENMCQAIAADILADRLLEITTRFPREDVWPILTVHDEIVFTFRKGFDVKLVIEVLQSSPIWAEGLPLAVSHKITDRYGK